MEEDKGKREKAGDKKDGSGEKNELKRYYFTGWPQTFSHSSLRLDEKPLK